jgi:transposase-like protein
MSTTPKKNASKGKRYTEEEKAEILKFINQVNSDKGRGGQSAASKKYGISQLTLSSWMKKAANPGTPKGKPGRKPKAEKAEKAAPVAASAPVAESAPEAPKRRGRKPGSKNVKKADKVAVAKAPKAAKAAKAPKAATGGYGARIAELVAIGTQIDEKEREITQLKAKFASIKAAL